MERRNVVASRGKTNTGTLSVCTPLMMMMMMTGIMVLTTMMITKLMTNQRNNENSFVYVQKGFDNNDDDKDNDDDKINYINPKVRRTLATCFCPLFTLQLPIHSHHPL